MFLATTGTAADRAYPVSLPLGKCWQMTLELDRLALFLNPFNPLYSNGNIGGRSLKTPQSSEHLQLGCFVLKHTPGESNPVGQAQSRAESSQSNEGLSSPLTSPSPA